MTQSRIAQWNVRIQPYGEAFPLRSRGVSRKLTPHKKYTVPAHNPRTPSLGAQGDASIMA